MRRRIVQLLVGCLSLLLLFVVFDWLFLSPYYPYSWEPKVPPAVVSRSEPNREGLITAARPLVTQIAPGEPLGVAIHWQRPDDAIGFNDGIFSVANSDRLFLPRTTINTVTFTLTSPDGTVSLSRVAFRPDRNRESMSFADMPGLVFEIDSDGVELLAPKLSPSWRLRSAWEEGKSLQFATPGVYRLGIRGQIVCYKTRPMEFESKPIEFEVLPGIKTTAALRDRAKYINATRWLRTSLPEIEFVADDEDGNRHFAFDIDNRGANGWKADFVFRPDGALLRGNPRTVNRCIAVGTLVETPRGLIPIERVRPGDQVVSFDLESKQRSLSTVLHTARTRAISTIRFGKSLRTTAEHPMWADGAWKRADEVELGDRIESSSGPVQVDSIEHLSDAIDVVDLDVGEPHNYFAGGVLVHNKDVKPPARHHDWWYKLPGVPAPPRD